MRTSSTLFFVLACAFAAVVSAQASASDSGVVCTPFRISPEYFCIG